MKNIQCKKTEYLAADYVEKFACKLGACRNCCCVGWTVSVTWQEYMHLLGLQCKKSLKNRIDDAFFVPDNCSNEHYAELKRDYTGNCRLRETNGLCALQRDLGEDALPSICKMYPRNFNLEGAREAACALSCEAVLETLFAKHDKLTFVKKEIETSSDVDAKFDDLVAVQKQAIDILQDRTLSISQRLKNFGDYVLPLDKQSSQPAAEPETNAFSFLSEMVEYLCRHSASFSSVAQECVQTLNQQSPKENFFRLEKEFSAKLPDWETYFEQMTVNHLFFKKFPRVEESFRQEYGEFVLTFSLLKMVAVCYMRDKTSLDDFVDCAAMLFRYFEHGDFGFISQRALTGRCFRSRQALFSLLDV